MGHLSTLLPTVLVAACLSAAVASSVHLAAGQQEGVPSPMPATSPVEFVRDIQPILVTRIAAYELAYRLCLEIDRAVGALLSDLKARGLLDTTLVVWGGEFGRTPINEARNGSKLLGRDHHPRAFTMWMAGGGISQG